MRPARGGAVRVWRGRDRFFQQCGRLLFFGIAVFWHFFGSPCAREAKGKGRDRPARSGRRKSMAKVRSEDVVVCEYCGGEMVGRRRRFCNFECRQRANYVRRTGRPAACWVPRSCRYCGAALTGQRWSACSSACRSLNRPPRPGVAPKVRHEVCGATDCGRSLADKIAGAMYCTPRCSRRQRKRIQRAAALKAAGAA